MSDNEKPEAPSFRYTHAGLYPEDPIRLGHEPSLDSEYKRFNFDLCRAVDMNALNSVLNRMHEAGHIDKRVAELLSLNVSTALAMLLTENNRGFTARKAAQKKGY